MGCPSRAMERLHSRRLQRCHQLLYYREIESRICLERNWRSVGRMDRRGPLASIGLVSRKCGWKCKVCLIRRLVIIIAAVVANPQTLPIHWKEYFEDDILEEARVTIHPKVKKVRTAASQAEVVGSGTPQVGGNLSEDQMKEVNSAVKKMTDDDMTQMLEGMSQIGPEEEARMKAMGADPAMMKKAAEMMKSNPMMRKAAQMMMKNMSPDQMLKASQQAQSQMSNMSQEELESAMDQISKEAK